jgi:hypothetical protein
MSEDLIIKVEDTTPEKIKTILPEPNYIEVVSKSLVFKDFQVSVVLDLIYEGTTVPLKNDFKLLLFSLKKYNRIIIFNIYNI